MSSASSCGCCGSLIIACRHKISPRSTKQNKGTGCKHPFLYYGGSHEPDWHSSSDGGLGKYPREPPLLHADAWDAPGEALREPGRRKRLPSFLRRREGQPRNRSHLL